MRKAPSRKVDGGSEGGREGMQKPGETDTLRKFSASDLVPKHLAGVCAEMGRCAPEGQRHRIECEPNTPNFLKD